MGILNRLFGGKMNEPGEERTEKHPAEPQIRPVPEDETVTEKEPQEIIRVYEGYYYSYSFVNVHHSWCVFSGFGQMYNDTRPQLWYETE